MKLLSWLHKSKTTNWKISEIAIVKKINRNWHEHVILLKLVICTCFCENEFKQQYDINIMIKNTYYLVKKHSFEFINLSIQQQFATRVIFRLDWTRAPFCHLNLGIWFTPPHILIFVNFLRILVFAWNF